MWFSKVVQTLFSPLPILLFFLTLAVLFKKRKQKLSDLSLYIALGMGIALSNPVISSYLLNGLEGKFPSHALDEYPSSEVAVVLGGTLSPILNGKKNLEENNGSRLVPTFLLYKKGKVKKIIVSGGNPYLNEEGVLRSEAEDMSDFLKLLGVKTEDILLENTSRNTEENAREVAKILRKNGWEKPLLITSAFHMKRALFFFMKEWVDPVPVPVAHYASLDPRAWNSSLVPSLNSLGMASLTLKEHLGYLWAIVK